MSLSTSDLFSCWCSRCSVLLFAVEPGVWLGLEGSHRQVLSARWIHLWLPCDGCHGRLVRLHTSDLNPKSVVANKGLWNHLNQKWGSGGFTNLYWTVYPHRHAIAAALIGPNRMNVTNAPVIQINSKIVFHWRPNISTKAHHFSNNVSDFSSKCLICSHESLMTLKIRHITLCELVFQWFQTNFHLKYTEKFASWARFGTLFLVLVKMCLKQVKSLETSCFFRWYVLFSFKRFYKNEPFY